MFFRLLEKRFGTLPSWTIEKLENATIEELEQWSLRILEVDSLEQVFEQGLVKNSKKRKQHKRR